MIAQLKHCGLRFIFQGLNHCDVVDRPCVVCLHIQRPEYSSLHSVIKLVVEVVQPTGLDQLPLLGLCALPGRLVAINQGPGGDTEQVQSCALPFVYVLLRMTSYFLFSLKLMESALNLHSLQFWHAVVLGSNPAPPQHTANSVSPEVGSHLGWPRTVCWPLRGGRGTPYT